MARKGKLKSFRDQKENERPIRLRRYQYLFLIVCEDENTEPTYFEHFKNQIPPETIYLKPIGTGRDAKGVVEQTIIEKEKLSFEARKDVDLVWAVFDKDDADENSAKIKRFEDAFTIAEDNNIKIAYSNEVFELWLLLHLTDVDSNVSLPRKEVYILLQEKIKEHKKYKSFEYRHGDISILNIIYEVGSQEEAINRAERLLLKQKTKKAIEANPSTKIHLLVSELLEWIRYYSYTPD
jgi:hypothetical protein